jgi:hypothetical protein
LINFSGTAFVKCPICNDHVLREFIGRHIELNHPEESQLEDENDVAEETRDDFCEKKSKFENDDQSELDKVASCPECKVRFK